MQFARAIEEILKSRFVLFRAQRRREQKNFLIACQQTFGKGVSALSSRRAKRLARFNLGPLTDCAGYRD
jgi:hypothetical protein